MKLLGFKEMARNGNLVLGELRHTQKDENCVFSCFICLNQGEENIGSVGGEEGEGREAQEEAN